MKKVNYNGGAATLELVIAFAILVLNITAVLLLINGGQSIYVDSETNNEALAFAQQRLENARSAAESDFASVADDTDSITSGPLVYSATDDVEDISDCLKKVITTIDYTVESKNQSVTLNTFLGSAAAALALGGDCAMTPPGSGDWKKPIQLSYSGSSLKTDGKGQAIDVRNNLVYLTTKASGANKDDFYIFDTTNINSPVNLGHVDISAGLEDIDVANGYAFIANDEGQAINQLVVVDVSDPSLPLGSVKTPVSLPGVSGSCPNTCPGGRSIYYYKDKIYIGTHRMTANGAAEFHVFNVTNPSTPLWVGKKGGASLGDAVDYNMNKIIVRDQTISGTKRTYAYIATSGDSSELIILNVTNPSSIPDPTGSIGSGVKFNLPGVNSAGENLDATALFISGNRAYIGRERAANAGNKDFYIVDLSNPGAPLILGSKNLGLNSNGSYVVGIRVVSNLALVATTDPNNPFFVLDVSNPASITRWDLAGCNINFSTYATGIDYDNNLIYVPLFNASSNVNLKVIKATGGSC